MRDEHPLNGWNLRPGFTLNGWTEQEYIYYGFYYSDNSYDTDYVDAALQVTVGRQIVLGERFTFDIHGGMGYGAQWRNGKGTYSKHPYNYTFENYVYSHVFLTRASPLVMSGGMMFGYII